MIKILLVCSEGMSTSLLAKKMEDAADQAKKSAEEASKLFFELKTASSEAGLHKMGFRVYPVNKKLPHRMDFAFVRWIQL